MQNPRFRILILISMIFHYLLVSTQDSPLKVLVVTRNFPSVTGVAVLNQITGLLDLGVDVHICAKNKGNYVPELDTYNLLSRTTYGYLNVPDLDSFDIIYCQSGSSGFDFAKIKKKFRLKGKLVTCFRGQDISKVLVSHPHKYDQLFKSGVLFLPVCDYFKSRLIQLGCDPKKIITHHSALSLEKFDFNPRSVKKNEDTVMLVTVGRLIKKKGLEYSIKAVAQLLQKYPNLHYTIVGPGELYDSLQQLIQDLGVAHNISLKGYAPLDQVISFLQNSDIFILSSITDDCGDQEGIPNVLKEAMACGLPVISTFHAGVPELVENGKSGLLVPEKNVAALVDAIDYLLIHPEQWSKMGTIGRKKVEQEYDKQIINKRLVELFKLVLERK